jgi:hypothetical protein
MIMKTADLSGKRGKLFPQQFREMREMLAGLTPAERATLLDPEFITEDEADIIVAGRRMKKPDIPIEEISPNSGRRDGAREALGS